MRANQIESEMPCLPACIISESFQTSRAVSNRLSAPEPCASVIAKLDPLTKVAAGVDHDHIRGVAPKVNG
ncbi:MAG: hypothetical protein H6Q89_4898 [Myxococcaceae bacterium]|nr:hypothetical protein [Myxococcaceae bacterium]